MYIVIAKEAAEVLEDRRHPEVPFNGNIFSTLSLAQEMVEQLNRQYPETYEHTIYRLVPVGSSDE